MIDTKTQAGRIRKALYQITDAWDDTLEPARRATGSHASSSFVNPPLPVPADVLDKRRTAHTRLAYWARLVIAGRKMRRLPAVDVPALAAFLLVHCDWLAESYPKAVNELESSAADLGMIAADNAPRRFRVGACPGTNQGQPCPGVVGAIVRADDDLLPSQLACDALVPHSWPAGEWRVLERRLHRDEVAAKRLTAQRGALMVEGAVRRFAHAISA
jgi:hypothetical protein